ncbi:MULTISPECIES: Gfo/Idh/MocA family oxidoreductase [Paenibacillus]|uniref:Dehydrogenase n=1 Tax=Paenibacillus lactis TaxID=228574 RepID=A0ABS4FD54_9BACL|nr:Gfo/Idh/MocA family oxidoreductase [Paenibacillus lactis]MBP1894180.1 putative dehydrogenase [Paenibacillus lactis]MCM3492711.1 Gfo/Idh/MocA family oxidoreductase [Paenibacillus lactis]GIO89466.1 alpha-N-acetylgalactosaminidase [Paenibacillus lactis]HAF99637.1 glycosyl hydrolase [Paenibacillus lactis]
MNRMIGGRGQTLRLGFIGLGKRGKSLLELLVEMPDVEIAAISDLYEDRLEEAARVVTDMGRPAPASCSDYREVIGREDVEAVIIASSWTSHSEIAIAAMQVGKPVASEVGGAASLEECWQLVRTYEATGTPCMLLENCCYGREEMALLHMVRQGVFGELIHCQGAYGHDLRDEVAKGIENRHYRIHNYLRRNGDVYPTHGLGPAAKLLNINRGNRMTKLSSMATKSRGVRDWARRHLGEDHPVARTEMALGDVVTTMIQCANGETILLTHDTSLPRPYSRGGRVQGTRGIWMEDGGVIHLEGRSPLHEWEPFEHYLQEYEHPLWTEYMQDGVRGGHGGMDYLCLRAFVESVLQEREMPIDVYDMASWMAVTALSEQSIETGSAAVAIPDFTNGKWMNREAAEPAGISF